MAGAAWWHSYNETDESARFWGKQDATLLLRSPALELLRLAEPARTENPRSADSNGEQALTLPGQRVGEWSVVERQDLSGAPGLVHFRHALTYDDNFQWPPRTARASQFDAAYALRFADGARELILLLPRDFSELGRLDPDRQRVVALPCPRMAASLTKYLRDIGALNGTDEH